MSEELAKILTKKIEELEKEIKALKGEIIDDIPIYTFSKIRDKELEELFDIEENINDNIFDKWFNNSIKIDDDTKKFLQSLIDKNIKLIQRYKEEDLKMKFIAPILNRVEFESLENGFRDFYELSLIYKTDRFILQGTIDCVVSKGLIKSKKPYFFIQEFKRDEEFSNPRPQLIAELIAGVELNNWKMIKGAYIVGSIWRFVILEKLDKDKYQYFLSRDFLSTNIDDLIAIYKNLLFVKDEIIKDIQNGG